jgi:5-(carboxyamino)imidazole ribonucleotide synthase
MIKTIQQLHIGILGGGQLGRMMIQSAINLNLNISVLDPDNEAPCKNLVNKFIQGSLTDYDTVYNFGKDKDLITIEIENVNIDKAPGCWCSKAWSTPKPAEPRSWRRWWATA